MFQDLWQKIRNWYRSLPDKKRYFEFIAAVLTVPVLLTVLITNLSNINNSKKSSPQETSTTTPAPTERTIIITNPTVPVASTSPTLTPTATQCKPQVGPVEIASPVESQLISDDPLCLQINYQAGEFCSVVYSYSLDNSNWSPYTDKSICLYNLAPGPKTLELKIKSSQSADEITLIRNFYYKSKAGPTPTGTIPSITPLASPTVSPTP
ncbi:hypothetical protein M1328_04295 [Patescibacteria group bacterium]|nr:hypothetical protein [Patescibacteria group bacterium]